MAGWCLLRTKHICIPPACMSATEACSVADALVCTDACGGPINLMAPQALLCDLSSCSNLRCADKTCSQELCCVVTHMPAAKQSRHDPAVTYVCHDSVYVAQC